MGDFDDMYDMGLVDISGMPTWEEPQDDAFSNTTKYSNYTDSSKVKELKSIEIKLTPVKYLNSQEARYLRASLINNKINDQTIDLEIMHDKYNNNDKFALEVYCNRTMIGYIQKYDSDVNINSFCFDDGQLLDDISLKWSNNKFILSKYIFLTEKKVINEKIIEEPNKDSWDYKLLEWADENNIPDMQINYDVDDVIEDIKEEIKFRVGKVDYQDIITNSISRQRVLDCINIDDILEEQTLEFNLPFLFSDRNGIKHMNVSIPNHIVSSIIKKHASTKIINYGIPKNKDDLMNLEHLNLSWQKKILSKEIFNLKNLKKLNINFVTLSRDEFLRNNYTPIENIINLTKLEELKMNGRHYSIMPPVIFKLTSLNTLCYENSYELISISDEITNLKNLKKLYLKNNSKLVLTDNQKKWLIDLKNKGCDVQFDKDLLERQENKVFTNIEEKESKTSFEETETKKTADKYVSNLGLATIDTELTFWDNIKIYISIIFKFFIVWWILSIILELLN